MTQTFDTPPRVAIVGAGPAGLVAARWLRAQGFEITLYDAAEDIGGQWNPAGVHSATWPGMVTNTSRVMTAFSDLDHRPGTATYVRREDMHAYLDRYCTRFQLRQHMRLGTRVEHLARADRGGWELSLRHDGQSRIEHHDRVVIASGRHQLGSIPRVAGLGTFAGKFGVAHTSQFSGAALYRDASVLIAGCSISALEIATLLAQTGVQVTICYRRQRYVLPKLIAGVPTEHALFTRAAALAAAKSPAAAASALRAQVIQAAGRPEQYGALPADPDIFAAGLTQCQGFLPAVAEGRIAVRPWIAQAQGRAVTFADGSTGEFDGILFGTGYELSLPWLAPEIAETVELTAQGMTLFADSFHPDLDGLAFLGLYDLVGPYLPVLELQARYIAGCWKHGGAQPTRAEMQAGIAAARRMSGPLTRPMHVMALEFARRAGVEPDPARHPDLAHALLSGPLSPASFRLEGPDSLPDARERVLAAASAFGAVCDPEAPA
ncbi:NAD(P)-binding protein [Paracoccus limosus]|uniref:Trimethylamine monooxygenase n=1 Tax=Paracoccus limosus TaxID=913252 RepID=A0A844H6T3_9RHOB|nr:FAD-dependent oxidoreductase [Paracoccus limosus]MTH36482.1 NAD(P)-binding protein [Paracoccus limosus]